MKNIRFKEVTYFVSDKTMHSIKKMSERSGNCTGIKCEICICDKRNNSTGLFRCTTEDDKSSYGNVNSRLALANYILKTIEVLAENKEEWEE